MGAQKNIENFVNIDKPRPSAVSAIIGGGVGIVCGAALCVLALPLISVATLSAVVGGAFVSGFGMMDAGAGSLIAKKQSGVLSIERQTQVSIANKALMAAQEQEAEQAAKLAEANTKLYAAQIRETQTKTELIEARAIDAQIKEKYGLKISPDENNPQRLQ